MAALLLLTQFVGVIRAVALRHELLAEYSALTEKLLATMITVNFLGAVALAFLAFGRQKFGLWIFLACAAVELALETWAGFSPLVLARHPLGAALVFVTAHRAWRDLHALK